MVNYYQIGIFFLQGTFVSFLILLLFHLRKKLGIGILFAGIGLFQFMQVFLSGTVYVEIAKNFLVSPGSSVFFTATLFAVLIIYIKEDADETRKIIYALLITNIVTSFLIQTFSWNIKGSSVYNPFNVSSNLFNNNAWVLLVGTATLFLDSLLIIIIYEFISKYLSSLFFQICLTMLAVIGFDTVLFSGIAFWNSANLNVILISGLISKGVFVVFYSIVFYLYLRFFDKKELNTGIFRVKDVFKPLTYRQKFEKAKLSEVKYQTLTNISPVGIFHTRIDGYTTYVNPKWCSISGLSMNEAIGNGWLKAVHPDDIEKIKTEWKAAVEQKRISETEYRFLLADGSVRWVLGRAVPEYDTNNRLIGYVGTITDITKLKLYQQEQVLLKEKAEKSNRLKSAFLNNINHEIRTPMNGILGFSELLKRSDLSEIEQKNYISVIEKSGKRMLDILNDIISLSIIESGEGNIDLNYMNSNKQLEDIYLSFKQEVENKGPEFSFNCSLSDKDSVIKTDKEKFTTIITKLLKNAIKYTDKGTIKFGYVKKGEFLEFYVKDSGTGIPKESLVSIFDRFIQVDIEDKAAKQGAGLGLSIAKAYVELLGGTIRVESKENIGSGFYFTLPISPEEK